MAAHVTLPLSTSLPTGYCFEQNGLLSAVLRGAGFDVLDTAARVVQSGAAPPADVEEAPPLPNDASELSPLAASSLDVTQPALELRLSGHDHHVLLVGIEGQLWLADVGFGGESSAHRGMRLRRGSCCLQRRT